MFGMGMPEIILILAIALIVIGPKKLPDLAKSLGRALGEFKKATTDLKESFEIDNELSEAKAAFNQLNENLTDSIGQPSPGKTEEKKESANGKAQENSPADGFTSPDEIDGMTEDIEYDPLKQTEEEEPVMETGAKVASPAAPNDQKESDAAVQMKEGVSDNA